MGGEVERERKKKRGRKKKRAKKKKRFKTSQIRTKSQKKIM